MSEPVQNPLQEFIDAITPVISDGGGWVTDSLDRFIQQAILQRYSKDCPLELVSDVAGNGTSFLALPVAFPGAAAVPAVGNTPAVAAIPAQFGIFDPKFSSVRQIEYPIGNVPEEDVRPEDWQIYRTPTGYQLQLMAFVPQPGELCRITWTAQHAPDGSTVAQADFYAVCDFAASLCLEAMAARASQFGDNTMGADTVNYRSKSQEFLSLAKAKRKSYFNHFGIDENDHSVEDKPAISVGSLHNIMSSAGVDRIIHGRYTR
jgi:hypothetical protein